MVPHQSRFIHVTSKYPPNYNRISLYGQTAPCLDNLGHTLPILLLILLASSSYYKPIKFIPIINQLNLDHDLFIAGVLAGLFSGVGIGIVFKYGGTTGGTDIIARILDLKLGIPVGKSLLALDAFVLTISLSYLDIKHMIYTLLASFVLARITDSIQAGSYAARGLFIISDKYEQIAKMIDVQLDRGYTFINAEGGFDRSAKKIIYCVISPREISQVKELILREDPNAFVSIIDVHEALGQGFTYERKKRHIFFRR